MSNAQSYKNLGVKDKLDSPKMVFQVKGLNNRMQTKTVMDVSSSYAINTHTDRIKQQNTEKGTFGIRQANSNPHEKKINAVRNIPPSMTT